MPDEVYFILFKLVVGSVVGGVLGSFLGLVCYRLPLGGSIVRPRSYCDSCRQTLEPRDLIPIVSYCLNGGECRFCHAALTRRHLIFEAAGIVVCVVFTLWAI